MSRVGKVLVPVPEGVNITISAGEITATGKLGKLSVKIPVEVVINVENKLIKVTPANENAKNTNALWGLTTRLVNNMVIGVSVGFEQKLDIIGVGYKAAVDGKYLTLNLGYSHEIKIEIPQGITIKAIKPTELSIFGHDKQQVGQVASLIRSQRKPEPYKGKGIKRREEKVLRKEGKKK